MQRRIVWEGTLLLLSCSFIAYYLSSIIMPFLVAFILAYFLQPLIVKVHKKTKLSPAVITFVVFTLSILLFIAGVLLLAPILYGQFSILVENIPRYEEILVTQVKLTSEKLHAINPTLATNLSELSKVSIKALLETGASVAGTAWDYTLATINFLSLSLLVPVLLYYFLLDWPRITATIEDLIPARKKNFLRYILVSADKLFAAYIKGQINLCFILALYYTIGLYLIGFDLAFLFGICSGLLSIIPFIGWLVSVLAVNIVFYSYYDLAEYMIYANILYIAGNIIQDRVLIPRILGDKIGLHPLWIIFAMLSGIKLAGITGAIISLPIAGIIKILLSSAVSAYKKTSLYLED